MEFLEIKHRIFKDDQVFPCAVYTRRPGYVVLRYVNRTNNTVAGVTIPPSAITLGHYRQDAESVWWEMYHPDGEPLADLVHLTSPAQLAEGFVEYTDLLLDIWKQPEKPLELLDEDDLEKAVAEGYMTQQQADELTLTALRMMDDFSEIAPPLWHGLDPLKNTE